MIRVYVQNSKGMIKFNGQLSKAFVINTGLKQGDALHQCSSIFLWRKELERH